MSRHYADDYAAYLYYAAIIYATPLIISSELLMLMTPTHCRASSLRRLRLDSHY